MDVRSIQQVIANLRATCTFFRTTGPSDVKILAVETSGLEASVALADGCQLLGKRLLDSAGRRHARLLVPAVENLLGDCSLAAQEIDVVAISIGPGSFTGLRVGVVFAKTFSWINHARLVAVDTLQALAQRVTGAHGEITVIGDAQRGDLFVNSYQFRDDLAQPLGEVHIESVSTVMARLQETRGHLLTGPGVIRFSDQIPVTIRRAADDLLAPEAAALFPVAQYRLMKSQWSDIDSLEPVYLRRSYAEEKADPQ